MNHPTPEQQRAIDAAAPGITERILDILDNASAIHGEAFGEYLNFHVKTHHIRDAMELHTGALQKLVMADNEGAARSAFSDMMTSMEAMINVIKHMDDQVAAICRITADQCEEACKMAGPLAEISTLRIPGKKDKKS